MTCNPSTWEEKKDRLTDILRYKVKSEASLDSRNSVSKTLKKKQKKNLQAKKQTMFSASMYVFIITKLKNLKCDGTQL